MHYFTTRSAEAQRLSSHALDDIKTAASDRTPQFPQSRSLGGMDDASVVRTPPGFDKNEIAALALVAMCDGPMIELGCSPGCLVTRLIRPRCSGIGCRPIGQRHPAGRPVWSSALLGDVFQPLLGIGCWQTVRASVVRPESAQAGRCVVSLGLRGRGLRRCARRPARLRMGDVRLIGERVIDGMAVL
jgi:hypothetical protein